MPTAGHGGVLVLGAHPDDEVLGCGGTMAKLAGEGRDVHIALVADGVGSRDRTSERAAAALERRRKAAREAARILGARTAAFGDFPDNRMDGVDLLDIIRHVEDLIAIHQPEIVLTHHAGDLNLDHRRLHEAVVTACRPQRGHSVRTLLFFEVPSSTEWQPPGSAAPFVPNWFVDISATFALKQKALRAYAMEMREWPHPRSFKGVEALARWRGATVGADAAEAFILGRNLA
jgi:LmbE family N-acetylglucosaminyl deacetylase